MKRKVRIVRQPQYQEGGDAQSQIMQVIQAYAQTKGIDPQQLVKQLQQMSQQEQQQALKQMYAEMQGGEEQGQVEMAYGGQMPGYGLDLGSRSLWMNQNNDQKVNETIEEVPREEANIEAEKGETALIPMGDGTLSHKKIEGKRHTQGGTPLNVPEGTFIFSDTKKMKIGGDALKLFGKSANSKKKYTPADLAKQYPIDKYKAILNDPKADKVQRRTAELMIQNYEKKLAQLSLVQEGKKGFPQGIPQIAQGYYQQLMEVAQAEQQKAQQQEAQEMPQEASEQEQMEQEVPMEQPQAMYGMGFKYGGGLYKAQTGVQTRSRNNTTYIPLPAGFNLNNPNVKTSYDFTSGATYYDLDGEPSTPGTPGKIGVATRGRYNPNSWKDAIKKYAPEGYTLEDLASAGHLSATNRQDVKDLYAQYYKPKAGTPGTAGMHYYLDPYSTSTNRRYENMDALPSFPMYAGQESLQKKPIDLKSPDIKEGDEEKTNNQSRIPYGWTTPDKMAVANAMYNLATVRRQTPWEPPIKLKAPEFTYADPSRSLAANMEAYNTAARTSAMFGNPQSRYSLTGAAGQAASQAANIIGQYANQNLPQANQAAASMADMQNKQSVANAERAKRLYDAGVISQQQYDNAMRAARAALTQSTIKAMDNASTLYNVNQTRSDDYYIDPRTQIVKWQPGGRDRYFTEKRGSSGIPSLDQLKQQATALNMPVKDLMDYYIKMSYYKSRLKSNPSRKKSATDFEDDSEDYDV